MKVIKNVMLISLLAFSVSAFADDSFIVDIGPEYDSTNSAVFKVKIAAEVGDRKTNAFAFEVGIGSKTMRTNATYGFKTLDNHMWKVTGDFLNQIRIFDFSGGFGSHKEEVKQLSIGSAYRYNFDNSILKGFELSSYVSHAPSVKSTFNPEPYVYLPAGEGLYDVITFHGRLAGSTLYHHEASAELSPWEDGLITIGGDYEKLSFDNKWSRIPDSTNVGGHVKFDQVLLPWLKTTSHYRFLQTNQSYGGGVTVLIPSPKDVQFELVGDFSYQNNTAINEKYARGGLTLKADLWVEKHTTSYKGLYSKKSLRDWVSEPVVRIRDVMVMPEVSYSKDVLKTYINSPTNDYLHGRSIDDNNFLYEKSMWSIVGSKNSFDMKTAKFDKAIIDTVSKMVYSYYIDENNIPLQMKYSGSRKVVGRVGSNWNKDVGITVYKCLSTDATACKFEVEL